MADDHWYAEKSLGAQDLYSDPSAIICYAMRPWQITL